jgi:hypothetical protein
VENKFYEHLLEVFDYVYLKFAAKQEVAFVHSSQSLLNSSYLIELAEFQNTVPRLAVLRYDVFF